MIKRLILAGAAALALLAAPARATDITNMTEAETEAFGQAVRAYLLQNPEVLLEVIQVLDQRRAAQEEASDAALIAANAEDIFNDGYSHVMGNPEGDVVMVEFLDYRCGFCKRAFPEVRELLESDGNIKLIIKEFPILGDDSLLASRFAIAMGMLNGNEAYTKLHDELMTMRGNVTEQGLIALADRLGYDGQAVMAATDRPEINQIIGANHALAQRLRINGTPAFVIGDQMLRGYVPLDGMRAVVAGVRVARGQ